MVDCMLSYALTQLVSKMTDPTSPTAQDMLARLQAGTRRGLVAAWRRPGESVACSDPSGHGADGVCKWRPWGVVRARAPREPAAQPPPPPGISLPETLASTPRRA